MEAKDDEQTNMPSGCGAVCLAQGTPFRAFHFIILLWSVLDYCVGQPQKGVRYLLAICPPSRATPGFITASAVALHTWV